MADGGRVPMAGGGVPAGVQALMMKAMQAQGGGAQPGPGGPQGQPQAAPPVPITFPIRPSLFAGTAGAPSGERVAEGALAASGTGSGLIRGPGDGRSDSIDAEPAPDGYVIPASEVAAMGDGDSEAGAKQIAHRMGRTSRGGQRDCDGQGRRCPGALLDRRSVAVDPDRARSGPAAMGRSTAASGETRKRTDQEPRRSQGGATAMMAAESPDSDPEWGRK